MNNKSIHRYIAILKSYFYFFFFLKEKKEIIFFSEGVSHNQFYLNIVQNLIEVKDVILITTQYDNYLLLKDKYQIFYFGNELLIKFVINNINCNYFFTTTTDLGENFKKSKKCNEYIYIFHSLASCNKIYKKNAFNDYDIICANGEYQIRELKKMESLYNLRKKKYLKTGYSYFNYLSTKKINHKKNKLKKILVAPTWNLNQECFFDLYCEKLLKTLLQNNYQVILRPHPESIKRSKKVFEKLLKISHENELLSIDSNSDNFESMNNSDIMISDYSTIGLEYMYIFKKPVIYVDSIEKIHNKNYKEISQTNFEDDIRNNCKNIDVKDINNIIPICEKEFKSNNLDVILKKIKDNLFDYNLFNELINNYIKKK